MSGNGNPTVNVTGFGVLLTNRYRTTTRSGVMVSSSDSSDTSEERVKTRPPTESSAAESLACTGPPASDASASRSEIRSAEPTRHGTINLFDCIELRIE